MRDQPCRERPYPPQWILALSYGPCDTGRAGSQGILRRNCRKPRYVGARRSPLYDIAKATIPTFEDISFSLNQIGAHIMPHQRSRVFAPGLVPNHRRDKLK